MYLLRKLIRRNKVPFAAAAAVLATLCFGLSLSTWLFFQERAARQEAEIERKAEADLRIKDQAAQNIAQASLDVDAGNFEEAAALVQKISPDFFSPSLQAHAQVYRDIGIWYAKNQRWKEAATFFRSLLQVNHYRNYNSVAAVWDLLEAGASIVESGNPHGLLAYDQFRQDSHCPVWQHPGSAGGGAAPSRHPALAGQRGNFAISGHGRPDCGEFTFHQ